MMFKWSHIYPMLLQISGILYTAPHCSSKFEPSLSPLLLHAAIMFLLILQFRAISVCVLRFAKKKHISFYCWLTPIRLFDDEICILTG